MAIIQFSDVWEMYRIRFDVKGKRTWENFWALRGIDLSVEKGEVVGIIGENGAGKSTLLKIAAGMLSPDRGRAVISGRTSGLLELGAGFQPELTGRENIYLSAGLFGLTQDQIDATYAQIEDFASLGRFLYAPVKCYSQGMFVRLAFSIAVHMDPDIFLIDDTLAVGDGAFQKKCLQKIFDIKNQGKTILFVTHDMGLLGRLCSRAVLIKEGRVIKDGRMDQVASFGLQVAGEPKGVAVLEKKPLELVFNNGRLLLTWNGKLLMPHSGGHVVFRVADKWYDSSEAEWEVSADNNQMTARGRFFRFGLTQQWNLKIEEDGSVIWDIRMGAEEPLLVQEGCVNLMLVSGYRAWATEFEKGHFPEIEEGRRQWESLFEGDRLRACLGAWEGVQAPGELPSLIFEQTDLSPETGAKILNADCLFGARVLQYRLAASGRFTGKISLDVPDFDGAMRTRGEKFSLQEGPLKVFFDNGRLMLFWSGVPLTKGRHLWLGILSGGRWWFSFNARWDVVKVGQDRLLMKGRWAGLPAVQVLEAEIDSRRRVVLKSRLEVSRAMSLEHQRLELMGSADYSCWFSDYSRGVYPDKFMEGTQDMAQRCIPDGTIGLRDPEAGLPALAVSFDADGENFGKILNGDFYDKARIVRIEKVEAEKQTVLSSGSYPVFSVGIEARQDVNPSGSEATQDPSLEQGRSRFVFDQGRGRLFWLGRELTKALGLYTSLRSAGRWHDSITSASWKIQDSSPSRMRLEGKWKRFPVGQVWDLAMAQEGVIDIKVTLKVDDKIELDRLLVNLMLLESYTEWSSGLRRGAFPAFRKDVSDDWDRVCAGEPKAPLGVSAGSAEDLPRIQLSLESTGFGVASAIVNTDLYYRGRILQVSSMRPMSFDPGEYLIFQEIVSIEPTESPANNGHIG